MAPKGMPLLLCEMHFLKVYISTMCLSVFTWYTERHMWYRVAGFYRPGQAVSDKHMFIKVRISFKDQHTCF
jgi:hypothetical protein